MELARFNNDSVLSRIGGAKDNLDILDHQNTFRLLVQDAHVLLAIARGQVKTRTYLLKHKQCTECGEENDFRRRALGIPKETLGDGQHVHLDSFELEWHDLTCQPFIGAGCRLVYEHTKPHSVTQRSRIPRPPKPSLNAPIRNSSAELSKSFASQKTVRSCCLDFHIKIGPK